MSKIKEKYNELKKKYTLPDFNELNNEFEISAIENKEFLLREIRRKIDERAEAFLKILSTVLQPETNIAEIHECREFSDEEKERVYKLYKKLMLMHDSSLLAGLSCKDDENAKFISEALREWQPVKKQMTEIVKKMRDTWKKETDIKEELGYLG